MKRFIINRKGIFADHRGRRALEVIEGIRDQLANVRGQLSDLGFEFSGLSERLEPGEHGLTLVISYLHGVNEEIAKWESEPVPPPSRGERSTDGGAP